MSFNDLKLYVINTTTLGVTTFAQIEMSNTTTLGVTTFAQIEMSLKVLLLIVTIGYTLSKWIQLKKKK